MKLNKRLEFKFIDDIMYYDGPLISLAITQDNQPVLEVWLDVNNEENFHLYAYVFMQEEDLLPFINNQKMYHEVLKDSKQIISWKYNNEEYEFEEMNLDYFMENYGPTEPISFEKYLDSVKKSFEEFINNENTAS